MSTASELLRQAIAECVPSLLAISDSTAAANPHGQGAWSAKQELGHLVDSAANNRVRFVRAALEGQLHGPSYDGRGWVDLGGYADMPWPTIVDLWRQLNLALAVVVDRIPEARLAALCRIADNPPVTLEFLIQDYVDHMRHHLDHILAG